MTDSPTRDDALLPCPFCGSPAESMNYFKDFAVECTNIGKCPAYRLTCSGVNRVEAAKKWNTRAGIVIDRDKVPWKTGEPPKDGSPFYARFLTPMRWKPYKPNSEQFRSGTRGRWQAMNDYGGWENTEYPPTDWALKSEYDAAALLAEKVEG